MEVRDLLKLLRSESSGADVRALLEHPDLEESHLLALFRKRDLPTHVIEAVARQERWGQRHRIRAAIANHPQTPKTLVFRLLNLLFWQELLRVAQNFRLPMPVRVAAENHLRERLPELELGERINLARTASPGLIPHLAKSPEARVIQALLNNPRLREMEVLKLADNPHTPSEVLRAVADSHRWSTRYPIRVAVLQNPRTPVHSALRLLVTLPRHKVRELVSKGLLPRPVRVGAERLLAGERIGRGFPG